MQRFVSQNMYAIIIPWIAIITELNFNFFCFSLQKVFTFVDWTFTMFEELWTKCVLTVGCLSAIQFCTDKMECTLDACVSGLNTALSSNDIECNQFSPSLGLISCSDDSFFCRKKNSFITGCLHLGADLFEKKSFHFTVWYCNCHIWAIDHLIRLNLSPFGFFFTTFVCQLLKKRF